MKTKVVILGAGESGVGTAILAKKQEMEVFVSDSGPIKGQYKQELTDSNIAFEEDNHTESKILLADFVVKSPGIPDKVSMIQKITAQKIPVISEIEFAARYTDAYLIGITGSNGKTTTAKLLYYILSNGGLNVGLAGNVGNSFARQVAYEDYDYYVIELSSFQLDGMFDFKADMSILMNITPDHLDRYDSFQHYTDSKFRILNNQTKDDLFIWCYDDPVSEKEVEKRNIAPVQLPFSFRKKIEKGAFVLNNEMIINYPNTPFTMSIFDLALRGQHNAYNSMAAGIAANVLNIRKDVIRESLSSFQGVEHRLEHVLKVHGIDFINDSKATNVNSTWYALECMPDNVIWIVGGVDKGNDYSILEKLVKNKVKAIVCLGKDNVSIHKAFGSIINTIIDTDSASEAVKTAYYLARKDDTVLLSPACASFDLFENYEDRGRQFKKAVRDL